MALKNKARAASCLLFACFLAVDSQAAKAMRRPRLSAS